jgi:hypothetical protein
MVPAQYTDTSYQNAALAVHYLLRCWKFVETVTGETRSLETLGTSEMTRITGCL